MPDKNNQKIIKDAVRKHYSNAIKLDVDNKSSSCCCSGPIDINKKVLDKLATLAGYTDDQLQSMPSSMKSFGCGNPVAFINVKEGQTVLDLGCGSGLDLILASRKVGESGRVIGLDMTDDMIEVCRYNLKKAGIKNAEVRFGEMESMPVDDCEADWIISNCVINLSPDKKKVMAEAFRVLKPGGQMMISDIVTLGLPAEYRDDIGAWVGCIAGAVEEDKYITLIKDAGFVDVEVAEKLVYDASTFNMLFNDCCNCSGEGGDHGCTDLKKYSGKVASARICARKPD